MVTSKKKFKKKYVIGVDVQMEVETKYFDPSQLYRQYKFSNEDLFDKIIPP